MLNGFVQFQVHISRFLDASSSLRPSRGARIRQGVYRARPRLEAMDYKATLMVLVLVSSALAGCTGDPDGGGGDEIDSDALQDLFDEHFEDFINNTTITVNNHYHNNTTVVNNDYNTNHDYNNTTNVDGGEINNYNNNTDNSVSNINGSGVGSVVQVFRTVWSPDGQYERTDIGSRDVIVNGIVQVPVLTGQEGFNSTFTYTYEGNTFSLSMTCEEFVNARWHMDSQNWENWLIQTYGGSSNSAQSIGNMIYYDLQELSYLVGNGYCLTYSSPWSTSYEYDYVTLFEISIGEGEAVEFLSLPNIYNITIDCDDGFSGTSSNGTFFQESDLIGGHSDCTIRGNAEITTKYNYNSTSIANGSGPSLNPPSWFVNNQWYVFHSFPASHYESVSTPTDFLIYFRMHYVEVYDLDSE